MFQTHIAKYTLMGTHIAKYTLMGIQIHIHLKLKYYASLGNFEIYYDFKQIFKVFVSPDIK